MTFLQGLLVTLATGMIIFILILLAAVKVGSDYDDAYGYDDLMERKNDGSSEH